MTAKAATELSMSARQRPSTTAVPLIGNERKRSVTPFWASVATPSIVASRPKSIVRANMPGIRNAK